MRMVWEQQDTVMANGAMAAYLKLFKSSPYHFTRNGIPPTQAYGKAQPRKRWK